MAGETTATDVSSAATDAGALAVTAGASALAVTAGQQTLAMVGRSKMFANAVLLGVAGFFGFWSAVSLQLQSAIISGYVLFFALLMCAFAAGAGQEGLRRWFGFVYTPHGQLLLLLVAGNLAWGIGTLGVFAAAVTNAHAAYSWYTSRVAKPGEARGDDEKSGGATGGQEEPGGVASPHANGWIAEADSTR